MKIAFAILALSPILMFAQTPTTPAPATKTAASTMHIATVIAPISIVVDANGCQRGTTLDTTKNQCKLTVRVPVFSSAVPTCSAPALIANSTLQQYSVDCWVAPIASSAK